MNNPLMDMMEHYQEQVEKADEGNTANLYKNTFIMIKKVLKDEFGFEIYNEEYLDGYFIFGRGSNSVVHFKVKGCKDWKFGVWWSYEDGRLKGEFFCQHERYLDKFKPSRGTYNCDLFFNVEDVYELVNVERFDVVGLAKIFNFIKHHPYITAMKDFHYKDYNLSVQMPIRAFFEYYIDGFGKWFRDTLEDILDKHMGKKLEYWGKKICEENEGYSYEVIDMEDCSSPRFDLIIKIPDNDEQETGCFSLFDNEEDQKAWNKHCKRLEKFAKIFGCFWYSSSGAHDCVVFWKDDEIEKAED